MMTTSIEFYLPFHICRFGDFDWTKNLRKIKLKVAFVFGLLGVQRHVSLCDDECLFVSVAVRAKKNHAGFFFDAVYVSV